MRELVDSTGLALLPVILAEDLVRYFVRSLVLHDLDQLHEVENAAIVLFASCTLSSLQLGQGLVED